jgi:L-ascorbate metabolism protein UlaG (beta-lactamase superfamily)
MKKTLLVITITMLWIGSCKNEEPKKSCSAAPTVSAGDDVALAGETSVTLNGTSSENDGTWSIVEGTGGEIVPGPPVVFKGDIGSTYKLKWTAMNDCGTSTDEMTVTFNKSCGDNQTVNQMVDNIHWIQQSCFRIESRSFTIYTDPNSITKKDTADVIVITHAHDDHWSPSNIEKLVGPNTILIAPEDVVYTGTVGKRVVLAPGNDFEAFGCVSIKAVPAYNINKSSIHPKAKNWVGYVITVDGVTIYHTGDTERIPEMKTITTDIIMLPLGQTYTFDTVQDAVEAAKDAKAKVAIPMHFGLFEGTSEDAQSFKNLLEGVIPVVIKVKGE